MASFASRTMQKLYSARLLLQHFDQIDAQDELVRPAYASAHFEAVVFHLQGALQALLYEIAETARLPAGTWKTPSDLQQAAEKHGCVLPQLNRVLALEKDSFSWLSQLQKRYQACWLPEPSKAQAAPVNFNMDLISVVSDSTSDQQQLRLWLDHMHAFVDDLRQTMQEF